MQENVKEEIYNLKMYKVLHFVYYVLSLRTKAAKHVLETS